MCVFVDLWVKWSTEKCRGIVMKKLQSIKTDIWLSAPTPAWADGNLCAEKPWRKRQGKTAFLSTFLHTHTMFVSFWYLYCNYIVRTILRLESHTINHPLSSIKPLLLPLRYLFSISSPRCLRSMNPAAPEAVARRSLAQVVVVEEPIYQLKEAKICPGKMK